MSDTLDLTVALPAYEEADNLRALLPELRRVLDGLGASYEIVVVDTPEPRDGTPEVCAAHGARHVPRVGGLRYGHAVATGIAASRGRWVVFMDADGSHEPEQVARLWEARHDADLVIASRYTRGGRTDNPAALVAMSLAVNLAFRVALGLRCADVSNSFRLYRGDDLRALTLSCQNFDVVEELLVRITLDRPGYRVLEIPAAFRTRRAGVTKRELVPFVRSYVGTLRRLRAVQRAARHPRA